MSLTEAQHAIVALQQQSFREKDNYTLEQIDRALDEIVRSYGKTSPALFQVRSAKANAAKVIQSRRETVSLIVRVDADDSIESLGGAEDDNFAAIDVLEWLRTTSGISETDRRTLQALAVGADAEDLSHSWGVPVDRMRERISRSRGCGRRAFRKEVAAA